MPYVEIYISYIHGDVPRIMLVEWYKWAVKYERFNLN